MQMVNTKLRTILFAVLTLFSANQGHAKPDQTDVVKLLAWPAEITEQDGQPFDIYAALENTSFTDEYVRLDFFPIPVPQPSDDSNLDSLKFYCRDTSTGAEVAFEAPPPGMGEGNITHIMHVDRLPAGTFIGQGVEISRLCDFKPGTYSLVMWYDTTTLPPWAHKTDHKEWKGITNKVTITIHIIK